MTIIFTHGDSDGICSGAIALSAYKGAHVFFTTPGSLFYDLDVAVERKCRNIIICDIAVDERTCTQLCKKLKNISKHCKLKYIDHHPLPPEFEGGKWFHHDTECCASELTYRVLAHRLDKDMRRVAIYGAIGDYKDNTPLIQSWLADWDKRSLFFQAGLLIQSIIQAGRDYDFKRSILPPLSRDIIPSSIDKLTERAQEASENEEILRKHIKRDVKRLSHLSYVIDQHGYRSKAAIYAAAYGGTPVGMAAEYREHKDVYDISVRTRNSVDINTIIRKVATKYDGSGGGHPMASGGRIPARYLEQFIDEFNAEIKSQQNQQRKLKHKNEKL